MPGPAAGGLLGKLDMGRPALAHVRWARGRARRGYLLEPAAGAGGGGEAAEAPAEVPDKTEGFSTVTVVWSLGGGVEPPQEDVAPTRATKRTPNLQYVSIAAEHTRCWTARKPSTFERPSLGLAQLFFYASPDVPRFAALFAPPTVGPALAYGLGNHGCTVEHRTANFPAAGSRTQLVSLGRLQRAVARGTPKRTHTDLERLVRRLAGSVRR